MTPRLVGGIAAATFAIGILTGAAGMIVVRGATTADPDFAAVMADHMDNAPSMMSGAVISGSMMRPCSTFGPGMMSGPLASWMPGSLHDQHHPASSPDGAQ